VIQRDIKPSEDDNYSLALLKYNQTHAAFVGAKRRIN
jgi:hypothetical protein